MGCGVEWVTRPPFVYSTLLSLGVWLQLVGLISGMCPSPPAMRYQELGGERGWELGSQSLLRLD